MKRLLKQTTLLLIISLITDLSSYAQMTRPGYEWGVNLGFLVYQGDLTPRRLGSFETQQFSLELRASHILSSSFGWRANLVLGKLKGDDARYNYPEYRQQRNFFFTSPLFELSGQLLWNITHKNYADKGFSPYLFAGTGIAFLNIKRDWSRINVNYFPEESPIWPGLAADSAHRLPHIIPVIPVGAGVKYFFTYNWGLDWEASYRIATTDYLDGFSQSADPSKKDNYFSYSAGILYRAGKTNKFGCPVMKY